MKILITGGDGQLGKELLKIFKGDGYFVYSYNRQQLDITDFNQIKKVIKDVNPCLIINTASFTQVDLCEKEIEKAYLVNTLGPLYLALQSKETGIKLFHISTDYVFSGNQNYPYSEEDVPNPGTIYGKSKMLGENLVLSICEDSTVIRTSWLYGHNSQNFVSKIKEISDISNQIRVVNDQYGCPTYTKDLGWAIKELIKKPPGIYHVTNSESCSWFEFASEVINLLKKKTEIIPVSTKEYGLKTPRPLYSVLSSQKLNNNNISLRHWKEGLQEFLEKEFTASDEN
ncbi:dTDP-4-dehydrorhamnose reductase [Priestia aryabhattai]|uniref:dTDP-4-dehydrorhamnose reductase n=1 Tax=Priestia aryabhattai TaxID=412384 RepID=UPI0008DCB73F|nr:dTDP-4-dehydrorhamnose reductase [Priestia aryabhattai]OHY73456.1 dTDP-4-dehydrorhamnose reductase [Priestia aryabhattai]